MIDHICYPMLRLNYNLYSLYTASIQENKLAHIRIKIQS